MPKLTVENGRVQVIQAALETDKEKVVIEPLKQAIITVPIVGETPLKVLRFSAKKQAMMEATQEAGSQAKSRKKREAKDFQGEYEGAKYVCTQGKVKWLGINATGVRNGCIECCRVAGYAMTRAKMSIFCIQDGYDDLDGTPLVRVYGEPEITKDPVRNASGVIDIRPRCMFREWKMLVRLRFDEGQFSPSDVLNLMMRVGQQNGLGEGRPNGREGYGTGNGLFVVDAENIKLERLRMPTLEKGQTGKE